MPKDQSRDELQPCPFCGGKPKIIKEGCDYLTGVAICVVCKDCFSALKHYQTLEQAITAWNTRQPQPTLNHKAVEEVKNQIWLNTKVEDYDGTKIVGGIDKAAQAIVSKFTLPTTISLEELANIIDSMAEYEFSETHGDILSNSNKIAKAIHAHLKPIKECSHNGYTIRNVCNDCGKYLNKEESDRCCNGG